MSARISRRFAGFVLVSGLAAAANFGARVLFSQWIGYAAAIGAAFVVGLTTAFALNRRFVFPDPAAPLATQFGRFVVVNLLALLQTLLISLLLAHHVLPLLGIASAPAEAIAHAVGIAVPALTSYVGHKYWTFR